MVSAPENLLVYIVSWGKKRGRKKTLLKNHGMVGKKQNVEKRQILENQGMGGKKKTWNKNGKIFVLENQGNKVHEL